MVYWGGEDEKEPRLVAGGFVLLAFFTPRFLTAFAGS